MKAGSSITVWLYRRTKGRIGGTVVGGDTPVLLLTTTGRKSGVRRTRPLGYYRDDSRFVICGSNGGSDTTPAWTLNLRSDPNATIEVGAESWAVTTSEAVGDEYERLWQAFTGANPNYLGYLEKTQRKLPLVVLEPVA
jgi:deazaflavin-dependent oxidoreductase (nitroreductase family)